MMLYVYVIFIPSLIIVASYKLSRVKPKKFSEHMKFIAGKLQYLFLYCFLVYFLEMENVITTGWVFYTLIFFLFPAAAIILSLRIVYWLREKRSSV